MTSDRRDRAFFLSLVGGATLLVLAVTVFAVAIQARSVSRQAELSVRLIEDLRVVSIARAELSIASRISAAAPEQAIVVESAAENAAAALAAVRESIEADAPTNVRVALDAYENAATAQTELILSGRGSEDDALDAELRTGEAFEGLSAALRAEQAAALERLRDDNDLMNIIGTVATFIVAFIVPTAALYIFEALRRTPRLTRELELRTESLERQSLSMAMATRREVEAIRTALLTQPAGTGDMAGARRSLLRLEHMASINGAVQSIDSEPVDVVVVAEEVLARIPGGSVETILSESAPLVLCDPVQLALAVDELVRNAINHAGEPVSIKVSSRPDRVAISVVDHGSGLPPVVESAVFEENDYAMRNNLASGEYGFGLIAARRAIESMAGSLTYVHENGRTEMIVEFTAPNLLPRPQPAASSVQQAA